MKKMLIGQAIAAFILAALILPVSAETEHWGQMKPIPDILFNENFDEYEADELITGFYTDSAEISLAGGAMQCELSDGETAKVFPVPVSDGGYTVEADVIPDGAAKAELTVWDSEGNSQSIKSIDAGGSIAVYIDFESKSFTCGEDTAALTVKDISRVGFCGSGKLTIDNFYCFKGSTQPERQFLTKNKYLAASKQKRGDVRTLEPYLRRTYNSGLIFADTMPYVLYNGSRVELCAADDTLISVQQQGDDFLIPCSFLIRALGGSAYMDEEAFVCRLDGKELRIDGASFAAEEMINGDCIVSASAFCGYFNIPFSVKDGMLAVMNEEFKKDEYLRRSMLDMIYYYRPKGKDVVSMMDARGDMHPRILTDYDGMQRAVSLAKNDTTVSKWFAEVKAAADSALEKPVMLYNKPDRIRILSISTEMVSRMTNLAFAYRVTGDERYAECAWNNLLAVSMYPDWNPSHFLDEGEMTFAFSIGYDWLYDYWSDTQKRILERAILEKGLGAYLDGVDRQIWWSVTATNWNYVCHGGIMTGAIALGSAGGDVSAETIERVFRYTEYGWPCYAPDGAWTEGTGYWSYATQYMVRMMSSVTAATGTDYGYLNCPGLSESGYFPNFVSGSAGVYNYGDSNAGRINSPAVFWIADHLGDSNLSSVRMKDINEFGFKTSVEDIIFYKPKEIQETEYKHLDKLFQATGVAAIRKTWSDPNGMYLGIRGGVAGIDTDHSHLDLGSFVFDVGGYRFFSDLGNESYTINSNDYGRLGVYRRRAEGHNTLVFNPTTEPDQAKGSKAEVVSFVSKPRGAQYILDLSDAYPMVKSVQRGFRTINFRNGFLVQDEIDLAETADFYWFAHTPTDNIKIMDEGKSAVLTIGSQMVKLFIISDIEGVFEIMDAAPLPSSPVIEQQTVNSSYKKLAIHIPQFMGGTLQVAVLPVAYEEYKPVIEDPGPLKNWSIEDGDAVSLPYINSVSFDGKAFENFDPQQATYNIDIPIGETDVPEVSINIDSKFKYELTKPDKLPGNIIVTVWEENAPDIVMQYAFKFATMPTIGIPDIYEAAPVKAVTASDSPQLPEHPPEAILDGDFTTSWTSMNQQWIMIELEEEVDLVGVGMAWLSGNERVYNYEVEISTDGENWETLRKAGSMGTTTELEVNYFEPHKAKYVRIQCNGNSVNIWNNMYELRAIVKK